MSAPTGGNAVRLRTPPDARADLAASGAESRTVDAHGLPLHALDFGGEGPAMLVLPGITSPAISWQFVARELADVARIVVADLRGRGLSATPHDGAYALEDYADDAAALVTGLGLGQPIVLGHSLGARVAAVLSVRHPAAAGPLVLVDPPLSGPGRDPYPTGLDTFLDQLCEARAGTTAERVAAHWPGWPRRELELRARWLSTCDEVAVAKTHRGFETEGFLDWWQRVPRPARLVRGGRSAVVTEAGARELSGIRPDIPIVAVPSAGHMVPWDDLQGFLEIVREFVDEHGEGSQPA